MMNTLYYIEFDGQQYGAYTLEQVRQFGIFIDTLVFTNELDGWLPASEYPELAEHIVTPTIEETTGINTAPAENEEFDIFNTNYYYKKNEQLYGPLSLLELVYLNINANTPLGINSPNNWIFAGQIDNLMDSIIRLSELDKEEYEAELQRIKDELKLSTQEFEEVIEEQEAELANLEEEIARLKQTPQEDISKEALMKQINDFKEKMLFESRQNFTKH